MTWLIATLLIGIWALAAPEEFNLSPQTRYEFGLWTDHEPPRCRKRTEFELQSAGAEPKEKAATLSLDYEYVCEHAIFIYGERDSLYDYIVANAPAKARRVAAQIKNVMAQSKRAPGTIEPWTLEVTEKDPEIAAYLRRVFETELASSLGPGAIARSGTFDAERGLIKVGTRQVLDAKEVVAVTAWIPFETGAKRWEF